jgi:FdhE protein
VLRCSFCSLGWEQSSTSCIYCEESGDAFTTITPVDGPSGQRYEACASCSGYLKAVDVPSLSPFPLLAIGDLETMDLDLAAMQRGFGRPQMRDFTGRKS